MRLIPRAAGFMLASIVLASGSAVAGCASNGMIYDTYRHDYHRWNRGEDLLYRQWEVGNHFDHRSFSRRGVQEQRSYWDWRHR